MRTSKSAVCDVRGENMGFFDGILALVGNILWPLFSVIGSLIDVFQSIFYAFAGIGTVSISGDTINSSGQFTNQVVGSINGENGGGIVYYFLTSDLVKNIFISILILAIFLLVIFTAMAFIRNAYKSKPQSWKEIVANAFKGLANFVLVPVLCLLGVWVANILLQAINGATRTSSSNISLSSQLFVVSGYNANRARNGVDKGEVENIVGLHKYFCIDRKVKITLDFNFDPNSLKTDGEIDEDKIGTYTPEQYAEVVEAIFSAQGGPDPFWMSSAEGMGGYEVTTFYDTWEINFIVLAGGGVFILFALGKIAFGMVKRLFNLILLFVASPAICAMYPLNDGSSVQSWKNSFIKNTLSAYGAVAGMNLFLCLVPIINQIDLYSTSSSSGAMISNLAVNPTTLLASAAGLQWTGIVSILLNIAALYMVSDFIETLTGFIGGDNAYTAGAGLASNSLNRFKKGLGHAVKGTTKTAGAFIRAGTTANRRRKVRKDLDASEYNKGAYDKANGGAKQAGLDAYRKYEEEHKGDTKDSNYYREARKAQKDAEKRYKEQRKEKLAGTSVAGGFFGSIGDSLVGEKGHRGEGGLLGGVSDWLGEKSGIGKPSEIIKGFKGDLKTSREAADADIKKKREGEFGEKKLQQDLEKAIKSGSTDAVNKFIQTMIKSPNGEKIFDILKGQDGLKGIFADAMGRAKGDDDLSGVSFSDFRSTASGVARYRALQERANAAKQGGYTDQKISDELDTILAGTGLNKDAAMNFVKKGDLSTDATADLASSLGDSFTPEVFNNIIGLAQQKNRSDQVVSQQVQTIQAQQVKVAENLIENDNFTNGNLTQIMSDELSKLQANIEQIKVDGSAANIDLDLSDGFKGLEKAQDKLAKEFAKAMEKNSETIVKELKKQQKKDGQ